MKFDTSHIHEIEHGIMPHLADVITVPVLDDDGHDTGIVIYVAALSRIAFPRRLAAETVETVTTRLVKLEEIERAARRLAINPLNAGALRELNAAFDSVVSPSDRRRELP